MLRQYDPLGAPTTMSQSPADELIDLLDENGKVVGIVRRGEVRRRRLPHRCVYILVFNSRGDLLIHQRTATKDVFPSYWDVAFGGIPMAGESFGEAAEREGNEELGIEIAPVELFPFRYKDQFAQAHAMVYRAVSDGPFQFQIEEVERAEFVEVARLSQRIGLNTFCPDGLAVWAEYQRRRTSPS
jgi:isopentenyldiphosphate isomerase